VRGRPVFVATVGFRGLSQVTELFVEILYTMKATHCLAEFLYLSVCKSCYSQ
jgi:hypothetical protein